MPNRNLSAKRIIGLPGDVVEIRDKTVMIDGHALVEPYVVHRDSRTWDSADGLPDVYRLRDQVKPVHITSDRFFILGDNRDESYDSRFFGPISRSDITGEVIGKH